MAEEPKVSIVLPTYNGARYLRDSIRSCLEQTHRNLELIVVDDASTDETPQILHACSDERIKVVHHEQNRKLPAALNTGFARATGEYLTWTSDDNLYAPRAIERMLGVLRSRPANFVYCDYFEFRGADPASHRLVRMRPLSKMARSNCVGACFLYSRAVKEAVGDYDIEAFLAEDYDYWLRVMQKFPLEYLAEPLYFFREHEGALTARFGKQRTVTIMAMLVRLKNHLTDVATESRNFRVLLAKHQCSRLPRLRKLARALRYASLGTLTLWRILARCGDAPEARRVLQAFAEGKVSMEAAKTQLGRLLELAVAPGPG